MRLKYIMVMGCPILFDEALSHKEVAAGKKVDSAGFVNVGIAFGEGGFQILCHGRSISLDISSNPEKDTARISRMFNQ